MYLLKLAPLRVEIIVIHALGWDVEGDVREVVEGALTDRDREYGISVNLLELAV